MLDWTRPWTLLVELHAWLECWVQGDGAIELKVIHKEIMNFVCLLCPHSCFLSPDKYLSGQAHLQRFTEPSAKPLATPSDLQGTIPPLGQGTFTHNTVGIPIIVAGTKADLIDDNSDIVGASVSGMGGMVKGKRGKSEKWTDGICARFV